MQSQSLHLFHIYALNLRLYWRAFSYSFPKLINLNLKLLFFCCFTFEFSLHILIFFEYLIIF
jgi:hypothetical protein